MASGPIKQNWLWRANHSQYVYQQFGDIYYLYSRLSGDTHVLNSVSIAMIGLLEKKAHTLPSLAKAFRKELEVSADECPDGVVLRLLRELDDVGLIERVGEKAVAS